MTNAATIEKTSDQCFTPEHIFKAMRISFDLDVAAPIDGAEWIPAKRRYTVLDDGLAQPWEGRVWMNPPFSNPTPWVKKFIDHGNGVALLPMSKSKWFDELWAKRGGWIVCVPSNTKFVKGGKAHSIFLPFVLAAFGTVCQRAIARVGRVR